MNFLKKSSNLDLSFKTNVYIDSKFYETLLGENRFFKIPEKPLSFEIEYCDTNCAANHSTTNILAIHGGGGHWSNFDVLIDHYRNDKDVRLLVPNLPDFSHTRSSKHHYWNSVSERLQFVKCFLRQINMLSIDCLVVHSLGAQIAVAFFDNVRHNCLLYVFNCFFFSLF